MRTILFVAPFALPTTARIIRAVAALADVRVIAVLQEAPPTPLGVDVVRCPAVMDDGALGRTLDQIVARVGTPHRLLGILEALQVSLARQRRRLGLQGPPPETILGFRDKDRMKAILREAGVGVAASQRVDGPGDVGALIAAVGLPLVLKPLAGAGAASTVRVDDAEGLVQALASLPRPLIAEQFLTGAEHSMEVFVRDGSPVYHGVTRYFPSALEVASNPHLQWVVHLPRDQSAFADARRTVDRALVALGMETGLAHAEWFRLADGSVAIGEIGARPPGAGFLDLHGHAVDADWFDLWARLMVDGGFDHPGERAWSVAGVYLRGAGEGRVVAIDGVEQAQREMGVHVVQATLPTVGQPRQSGYEGEGFVIIRHPDDEVVKRAALQLIRTVRVRYA